MVLWRMLNPLASLLAGRVSWWVLLETTGRRTGKARRVPLARGPVAGRTVWLISDHGCHADFARNIVASSRVRMKLKGRWLDGSATVVPLDRGVLRRFPLARAVIRLVGIEPKLVKVELNQGPYETTSKRLRPTARSKEARMRLPKTAFTSRPWRVHELTPDFRLEDVWDLPTPGGPDDLGRLVRWFAIPDEDGRNVLDGFPVLFRALFVLRWKIGRLFGWDEPDAGVSQRVRSLRERLPPDLLEAPRGPDLRAVPGRPDVGGPPVFNSIYQTHDEWLSEFSNETVHSLMHIGWVPDDGGSGYHAQMAVLVKPNGWRGKAYMAAIKPVRYALVYPMLLRSIERQWTRFLSAQSGPRESSSGRPSSSA